MWWLNSLVIGYHFFKKSERLRPSPPWGVELLDWDCWRSAWSPCFLLFALFLLLALADGVFAGSKDTRSIWLAVVSAGIELLPLACAPEVFVGSFGRLLEIGAAGGIAMIVQRPHILHSKRFRVLWPGFISASVVVVDRSVFLRVIFLRRALSVSSFSLLPWPGIIIWPQEPHTCCLCISDCCRSWLNINEFRSVMRCPEISGDVFARRCAASVRKPRVGASVSVAMMRKQSEGWSAFSSSCFFLVCCVVLYRIHSFLSADFGGIFPKFGSDRYSSQPGSLRTWLARLRRPHYQFQILAPPHLMY